MSKYTPGPWKLKHVENGHHILIGSDIEGESNRIRKMTRTAMRIENTNL